MKVAILLSLTCLSMAIPFLSDPPFIIYKEVNEQSCQDAIVSSLMDLTDASAAMYVLSTGTFLNNWGSYDACIKSAIGSAFWMVKASGKVTRPNLPATENDFRTGLCVPKDCTEDDIKTGLERIFIESAEFAGMSNPQVSYKNLVAERDDHDVLRWGETTFYLVLVAYFGLIGVGTIVHLTKMCNRKDINEELMEMNAPANRQALLEDDRSSNVSDSKKAAEIEKARLDRMKEELGASTVLFFKKTRIGAMLTSFSALRNMAKLGQP